MQERRISHGRKNKQKQKHLPRNYTEKTRKEAEAETRKEEKAEAFATELHGIKMRRQKKDWTSAYAKVTKARDKVDDGVGDTSSFPSFHAKAGNPEIQAAKERQIKREASFLDLSSFAIFASSR